MDAVPTHVQANRYFRIYLIKALLLFTMLSAASDIMCRNFPAIEQPLALSETLVHLPLDTDSTGGFVHPNDTAEGWPACHTPDHACNTLTEQDIVFQSRLHRTPYEEHHQFWIPKYVNDNIYTEVMQNHNISTPASILHNVGSQLSLQSHSTHVPLTPASAIYDMASFSSCGTSPMQFSSAGETDFSVMTPGKSCLR
jgi:hypothetical protein